MESIDKEIKSPMLWYWSVPEEGMDIEDCEKIAKESGCNYQRNKQINMYIAFV